LKLHGKRALITGASQGFGLAVAHAFVAEGASVAICARSSADLSRARDQLAAGAPAGVRIVAEAADVASPSDVDRLMSLVRREMGEIEVLVCNAGVYGPKGPIESVDWAAWEEAFAINVYGSVLLCRAVLPHMKAQHRGKIILLSGGGATKPLPNLSAYAASKAAIVRFGETLAGETRDFGIQVNAIAPGALNTRLLKEVLDAGPENVGKEFYEQSLKQQQTGGTPLLRGASLAVYLASEASDGVTGKLISAIWDPWESFDARIDDLSSTDIYTLRRIVPEDRGRKWD
jgi:3-oxoacyl-[acyl-carrier protein] reductase